MRSPPNIIFGALAVALASCAPAADLLESGINRVRADAPPQHDTATAAAGRALHAQLFVADLHADTLLWRRALDEPVSRGHVDLQRLGEGNVALQAFTIVTSAPTPSGGCIAANGFDLIGPLLWIQRWPMEVRHGLFDRAIHQIARLHAVDAAAGDAFQIIDGVEQLDALNIGGTVGGFIGLEGGHALEGRLENLDRLEAQGLRMFAPTHRFDNALGGASEGCGRTPTSPDGLPLSDFGVQAIRHAFTLNIAVDLAHASALVLRQSVGLALSARKPVVVSHTGFQGTHDQPRNMSDNDVKLVVMTMASSG